MEEDFSYQDLIIKTRKILRKPKKCVSNARKTKNKTTYVR
jgi:hypothetical protein